MSQRYDTFDAARDEERVARMVALAFGGTPEGSLEWLKTAGPEHLRVVREGNGPAVANLLRIPMGEFFGGRSVPLLGVAGVAVAPEERGRGRAAFMMREFIRSAFEEGWPLAGLYASTHSLYRKVGYEHAGHRFMYTVPLVRIDVEEQRDPGWSVTPIPDAGDPEVRACYTAFASHYDGPLDRGPYIWARVRKLREDTYQGFGVRDAAGRLRGYIFLTQHRYNPMGRFSIALTDFAFTDAEAGRRLWCLLRDFAMMGEDLVFYGGPTHPALQLLRQQRHKVELKDDWLIRVVDVKRALEARGYSPAVRAEIHLDVHDEVVDANAGTWILRIAEGRGSVERGGSGAVRVTSRGLATIYSGFNTARQAKLLGLADGRDAALAGLDGVFSRGTPWMSDMY